MSPFVLQFTLSTCIVHWNTKRNLSESEGYRTLTDLTSITFYKFRVKIRSISLIVPFGSISEKHGLSMTRILLIFLQSSNQYSLQIVKCLVCRLCERNIMSKLEFIYMNFKIYSLQNFVMIHNDVIYSNDPIYLD